MFYFGCAVKNQVLYCLDAGHFHPTRNLADKISSALQFVPETLLHVSRGVRWESDQMVMIDDPSHSIMEDLVQGRVFDRKHIGGLTFGLTMSYLGIAHGMSVALGFCAAFGSLIRPIFDGKFRELLATSLGLTVLQGVLACLIGIANSGAVGMSNKKDLSQQEKVAAIKAFDF